ncbi:hypothetical protein [Cupriavidus gilardii]|uniref:hypothetical protein n=1 Tax=Cupriavidus gilardii TaxID=82541 RepID=UPI0021B28485|nr:hypothetical protein [Cupriavidus gilardii]UXC34812.1 hypothetical protein N4G38_10195 [Cupriavidus gilardii]
MTTDEAVMRQAAHECLMRDLVEALETLIYWYGKRDPGDALLPPDWQPHEIARAMEVVARAKEQQQ